MEIVKRMANLLAILASALCLLAANAQAERIKDLASVQGVRSNQLAGYGLVVGLDGTGDQTTQTPFTVQSIVNMLSQLGVSLPGGTSLQLKNVAAVMVTATLPAFANAGETLDVTVSSLGNSKSLRGGTLVMTPLKGADGQVYAIAQGNLMVGGAGASAGGSSAQVNSLNAGRIPAGATVERAVESALGQGDFVKLELHDFDFTTASRVVQAINHKFGEGTANAADGRQVMVRAPRDINERVAFLSQMENLPILGASGPAKVILNARTGSVVMNQAVEVQNCAIAHGNLAVTISAENQVSQPNPGAAGQTAATQNAQVSIKAQNGELVTLPSAASLGEVVKALNAVGATPRICSPSFRR